jgi:hypothetical protein
MDRHGPVGAHRDAEQQLLQVGPVVLVVAERDTRRAVTLLGRLLVAVSPREGDGRGVIVCLPQLDLKLAHGAYDEGGEQGGTVGAVEAVEAAAKAIVAEEGGLTWLEAQVRGDAAGGPPGEPVEGAACEQEVGDEDAKSDGGGDVFGAPVGRREVAREERLEPQAVEEATDDGCGANVEGFEGSPVKGGGHQCLRRRGRSGVMAVMGAGVRAASRGGGAKKILARLAHAARSLARIFLLVKARGRVRSGG